jgi:hypothetical protein
MNLLDGFDGARGPSDPSMNPITSIAVSAASVDVQHAHH